MTRDEAVGWVQFQLGSRSDLVTRTQSALIAAQEELERQDFLPWFLRVELPVTLSEPNDARILLPENFIREWEDSALYILKTDGKLAELEKQPLDDLTGFYRNSAPGFPVAYALDNQYFRLFPTPDAQYNLRMFYYGHDDALTSNIENKWLRYAPWMLIANALLLMAPGLRDTAAYSMAEKKAAAAKSDLVRAGEDRDIAQRRLVMGGPL